MVSLLLSDSTIPFFENRPARAAQRIFAPIFSGQAAASDSDFRNLSQPWHVQIGAGAKIHMPQKASSLISTGFGAAARAAQFSVNLG